MDKQYDIGDGFTIPSNETKYLKKYKLVGKGSLHFFNELCNLVIDRRKELSMKEWCSLKSTLLALVWRYRDGKLFYFLLKNHGSEAIQFNAYQFFLFHSAVPVKVEIFKVMPTEGFEVFAASKGKTWFRPYTDEQIASFMRAIGQRNDMYASLPSEFIRELVFDGG